MRLPEGIAPRLARPVLPDRVQVKAGQVDFFLLACFHDQGITRALLGEGHGIKVDGMPVGIRCGIVGEATPTRFSVALARKCVITIRSIFQAVGSMMQSALPLMS